MTEAEREALELLNEERANTPGYNYVWKEGDLTSPTAKALLRVIEERNALRADMAEIDRIAVAGDWAAPYCPRHNEVAYIAAKHRAEPDPLVEALQAAWGPDLSGDNYARSASSLRAELAKRGIELARKENA